MGTKFHINECENNMGNDYEHNSEQISLLSGLLEFYSSRAVAQASFVVAISIGLFTLLPTFVSEIRLLYKLILHVVYIILVGLAGYCLKRFRFYSKISDMIQYILREDKRLKEIIINNKNLKDIIQEGYEKEKERWMKRRINSVISYEKTYYSSMIVVCAFPSILYGEKLGTWLVHTFPLIQEQILPFIISVIVTPIVISIVSVYIWEIWKQPRLEIEILNEPVIQPFGATTRAFYHLRVHNKGRSPAYNCRIKMTFSEFNTKKQLFTVNGKWDRGPQPLLYAPVPKKILCDGTIVTEVGEFPHDFLIPFAESLDIFPKSPEGFCFLIKYDNEEECYAFSSWGYLKGNGHKVKEWMLGSGEYSLEVNLTYSDKKTVKQFHISNVEKLMNSVKISAMRNRAS